MIIRKGELKDVPGIVRLSEYFFEESISEYGLKLDNQTIIETITNYITNLIVIVVEDGVDVLGVVGGIVMPSIFDKSQRIGQETMWYVDKDCRKGMIGVRLIKAFEKECQAKGADLVIMVHMGNLNADILDRYYKKRKYKLLEKQYIKTLIKEL